MICDNCGKNNAHGAVKCHYCGTELPKATVNNGFADILSIQIPSDNSNRSTSTDQPIISEGMYDADMQKLLKKSDRIDKTTQQNSKLGLIAVAMSLVIFISSLTFGIITIHKVNSQMKEIEQIRDSLMPNDSLVDGANEAKEVAPAPTATPEATKPPKEDKDSSESESKSENHEPDMDVGDSEEVSDLAQ